MSQVQSSAHKREIVEGKPRQVLSITEAKVVGFRFTDSQGYVDVGIALVFGTDTEDGGANIAVIEPRTLKELLTIPQKHIKDGIRKLLAQTPANDIAAAKLGSFEIGDGL